MSEQPEPNPSATPKTTRTASSAGPTKSAQVNAPSRLNQILGKVQPLATNVWISSRPTIAQGLKATIGTLQSAADQLDRQIQSGDRPVKPLNLQPLKQAANTFWTKTQPIWAKLIGLIRSRLPEDIGGKLTDRALSGVMAGLVLLLLTLTTHLPSGNATPKPQSIVASKPLPRTVPVRPVVPSQDPIAQRFPVDAQGSQKPFPTALSAPGTQPAAPPVATSPPPTSPIVPTTTAIQPTTPIAPASPIAPTTPPVKPTKSAIQPTTPIVPTPTPVKPTPVKLTPDQKLLAKLQEATGVGEASRNGNRPTLLQGVKPNKAQGSLQITLKPDWYDLAFVQQDTVAQDLFTKAQTLRFKTLELVNGAGEIVARSPVVGNEMVVLLRKIEN
jgi:hypothetical protein